MKNEKHTSRQLEAKRKEPSSLSTLSRTSMFSAGLQKKTQSKKVGKYSVTNF